MRLLFKNMKSYFIKSGTQYQFPNCFVGVEIQGSFRKFGNWYCVPYLAISFAQAVAGSTHSGIGR
jgi:hypothetical protein